MKVLIDWKNLLTNKPKADELLVFYFDLGLPYKDFIGYFRCIQYIENEVYYKIDTQAVNYANRKRGSWTSNVFSQKELSRMYWDYYDMTIPKPDFINNINDIE